MRKKLILILGVTFLVLFVAQAFIARLSLHGSFASLNRQRAVTNIEQLLTAMTSEADSLTRLAQDWAQWDETYAFMANPAANYLGENQIAASLEILELRALLYLDTNNRLVTGKLYDSETHEISELSDKLLRQLQLDSLIASLDQSQRYAGILLLPQGPAFVAAADILTSEGQGPPRGHIVMIRPFEMGEFAQYVSLRPDRLSYMPLASDEVSPDLRERLLRLGEADFVLENEDGQAITGHVLLPDVFGQPSLLLEVSTPLASLEAATRATRFYFWTTLLI
ncbi:MAG: CHASE4 domain-containing protein, partial [Candidatus Binatia bacterium]